MVIVHLTQAIVELARNGDRATLRKEFSSYNSWSTGWRRILRRGWSEELCAQVDQRFRSEMCRAAPEDPGRVPYFFLLFNDQRRKLDDLQANADLIRAEMLTPFFDIEFLTEIAAANIDLFIGHKLYVDWLHLFQPEVYKVPWQAYPGHVPCPVPAPADLEYQWGRPTWATPYARKLSRRMFGKAFRSSMVPGWLIRRNIVAAAATVTLLGFSNYDYLLDCADAFATTWDNFRPTRT